LPPVNWAKTEESKETLNFKKKGFMFPLLIAPPLNLLQF